MAIVHEEKRFKCNRCGKLFPLRRSYDTHVLTCVVEDAARQGFARQQHRCGSGELVVQVRGVPSTRGVGADELSRP